MWTLLLWFLFFFPYCSVLFVVLIPGVSSQSLWSLNHWKLPCSASLGSQIQLQSSGFFLSDLSFHKAVTGTWEEEGSVCRAILLIWVAVRMALSVVSLLFLFLVVTPGSRNVDQNKTIMLDLLQNAVFLFWDLEWRTLHLLSAWWSL